AEERHEKPRLPVGHLSAKWSVGDFRRPLEFHVDEIEQRARAFDRDVIAVPDGFAGLSLADTFGTASVRNHDGKSFREPVRQTDVGELRYPALEMRMRHFVRQDGRKTRTLPGEQTRRQDHMAQEHQPDGTGISRSVGGRVGVARYVHADGHRVRKWPSMYGLDAGDGGRQ